MLELRIGNTFTDIVGEISHTQWKDLSDKLSFRPKSFMFSSAYNRWVYDKSGKKVKRVWDGRTRQIWKNTKRCYYPTGLHSLVIEYLKETSSPYKVIDCRAKPIKNIDLKLSEIFTERPYQSVACDKSVARQRGIIQGSTGCGKTIIAAGIIRRLCVSPFLFFVTSIDLLLQAKKALSEFLTMDGKPLKVGQIGGGEIDIQDINVLTIQTAVRAIGEKWDKSTKFDEDDEDDLTPIEKRAEDIKNLLHTAQGCICDECITGDSFVSTKEGLEIMSNLSKKIGKEVLSFDGHNVIWKKITNFYNKGTQSILKVFLVNGMSIRCTANHLIMTKTGWVQASEIHRNDYILYHSGSSSSPMLENTSHGLCDINYVMVESVEKNGEEEVFDISVEDTHCFFANGLLVHNCQHWKAKTCQIVTRELKNCYYTFATSATPYRDEGDDMLIQACFGKKITEITASELIETIDPTTEKSYLMRPNIKIIHLRGKKTLYKQWQSIYKDQIVDNQYYNGIIANIASSYINAGRLVLILVQQINHGKYLESIIPGSLFVSGKSSKTKRVDSLEKLRRRDIKCLISTIIWDEGIDCRPLDTIILAGGGRSKVRAMQRIGRVLRPFPDKTDPTVIDFMLHQPYLKKHAEERIKMYSTEPMYRIEHIDPDKLV